MNRGRHDATSARKQLFTGYEITFNARLPGGATLFGGTSTDRGLTVQCDEPDNPNNDRYCDQRETGVPYRTQLNRRHLSAPMVGRPVARCRATQGR